MKFKQFYMLSEMNDYVATTSEPGGKDTILSDLKSFGYNGFKERTDAINLDLAKKINFSEVRFSGDYRHVLTNLKKKGYDVDKVLYQGKDMATVVIKNGDYLYQFKGDLRPLNGKPYVEMRIVDSKRDLSDDEVKHLINLTSDTSPGSRILDNSKPIWVQTFSIEALKSYLENHPHCSKKTKDLIDKEIKTRSAVGYTTDRQTAPNVDKGIFRDTAPTSHGGTDHKFNESVNTPMGSHIHSVVYKNQGRVRHYGVTSSGEIHVSTNPSDVTKHISRVHRTNTALGWMVDKEDTSPEIYKHVGL